MKTFKILLAALIVLGIANVLTACSPNGASSVGMERIEVAQVYRKTVELGLREVNSEDGLTLEIVVSNPEGKALSSAQVWLAYNPDQLKGLKLDTSDSAFELMAPYENDFDEELGLVMLGRSTESAISDTEIVLARVSFERLTDGSAMIDAYDYQLDLSGHTSVNTLVEGEPVNVLLQPESPLYVIK
ncbi:MAG: hypothetical protein OEY44_05140 [Candidatus Peregrinibacteria bacterium]|nr:hypothetical protein [Candidatus Peregrinibacteria bacterium]